MFETRNVMELDEEVGNIKRDPIFEPLNTLYDDPVEVVQKRTAEQINIARWTGDWAGISKAHYFKEKYGDVPEHLQAEFLKGSNYSKGRRHFLIRSSMPHLQLSEKPACSRITWALAKRESLCSHPIS